MHLDAPLVRTTGGTFGGRQWPAQALTTVPTTKIWFVSGSLNVYDVLGSDKDYSACASTYYPDTGYSIWSTPIQTRQKSALPQTSRYTVITHHIS